MKPKDDCATDHLVGIDGQVEALMDLLDYDLGCARLLGIHGPGGIGKTTLAKAIFDKLISNFHQYSFLRDVSGSSRRDGLVYLQKKLLSDVIGETKGIVPFNDTDKKVSFNDTDEGMKVIREKLHDKKVLIVLDDVDHREQLKKLIGKISWFGTGSRVVITTRDQSILESGEKIYFHEMKEMSSDQALQLYINQAFKRESPRDDYYDRFSRDIVSAIGGLPLIIKAIGSFLRGKPLTVWKDTLEKLRSINPEEVHRKLKISYEDLNFKQKQIFLDIACLPFHEEEISVSYMWEDSNFFPQKEIEVLSSLSLINITHNGRLWMHDLLKELGCHIIHEENLDPGKRSRLWISEEALDMVKTRKDKGDTEALSLAGDPTLLIFTDKDFSRLPNLRFLKLDGGSFIGDFANLLSNLRWFSWCRYPPDLMATNLFPQNLVVLQLSEFNGSSDWEGWRQIKMLHNLKVLQLTCVNMVRIDLSGCFALERLIIKECKKLVCIDRSIGELKQLAYLNIEGCHGLKDLPCEIGLLENLTHLSLSNCSKLAVLPISLGELKSLIKLDLSGTSIYQLPYPLGNLMTSEMINMEVCQEAEFPSTSGLEMKLEVIRARCRSMVGEVSSEIGKLSFLRVLDLSDTLIRLVPETIAALPRLEELILRNCNNLQKLPLLPPSLTHVLVSSWSLQSIPDLSNLTNIVNLLLSTDKVLPSPSLILTEAYNLEWIGKLSKLETLELCLPTISLSPTVLGSLARLKKLNMSGRLYPMFLMQPGESAKRGNLSSVATFPDLYDLENLMILKLYGSTEKAIQLGGLEQLRHLTVGDFQDLKRIIFSPSGLKNLKKLELHDCPILREIRGIGALKTLESLTVRLCLSIKMLGDLAELQKLVELKIKSCNKLRGFKGHNKLGCLSLIEVIECPSLKYWTNASDTMIPDQCQVVIQRCGNLSSTPKDGMFYKDYRDKFLGKPKSDSDPGTSSNKGKQVDGDEDEEMPEVVDILLEKYSDYEEAKRKQVDDDEDGDMPEAVDTMEADFDYNLLPLDGLFEFRERLQSKVRWATQVATIEKDVKTDDQVSRILSLMNMNDKDKRIIVVIHGADGIGKTTLAKLVYNQVSCDFDGCSFLTDIKEATLVLGGLQLLQTKLISDVLKRELEDVAFVNRGIEFFRDSFCNMRVLIVLDDVENAFPVQKLVGDCFDCFASGSRILVTTRNSVVLEESPQIRTYHVGRLYNDQAIQLFWQHASVPSSSHSTFSLSSHHLEAMAGLPLFVQVMAAVFNGQMRENPSTLAWLRWASIGRWDFPGILKEGYGTLDNKQKQIFLDISCFTAGVDSRIAWYLWYDTPFLPSREILTPLAKIGENDQIWMHSMLRRFGRETVRGENLTDPGRRSRLFNPEIALHSIKRKKGTEKVEALCLNFRWHTSDKLTPENFKSMPNLRFLQMDHADVAGDFTKLFPNLRWLRWQGCPRHLQATNFHLGNLTILELSWSKVTKDWEGWDQIEMLNLRVLDLRGCADLLVTPKFSGCKNLAILILERCSQLVKIDHSIGDLKCLVSLNLKFCTELSMLPVEVGHLTALKELLIDGTSVQEIPVSIGHLEQLETLSASNCFSLSQLPRTICHLKNISLLSLDGTRITALPDSPGDLFRLKHLSLRDCRRIRKLSNSIGNIGSSLVELDVSGTGISKFPDSIKDLQDLKVLRMDSCHFREFPRDIGELANLEEIHASWCRSLEGGIPSEIGKLHNLRILRLRHSSISSIPAEINQLSNLRTLDLLQCDMIKELPSLPSGITILYVDDELKSSHQP